MRNLWKVGALSAVFGAVLGMGGCSDFQAAYEGCQDAGRCGPQASGDGGSDAGDAGDGGEVVEPEPACEIVSATDEPDPEALDLNCDGVDGMADAGYFVDPVRGKDSDDGTQRAPVQTLHKALELIQTAGSGRTHIYLGVGTYNEPETVVTTPVSLHGGYRWNGPGDRYWSRFKTTTPTLVDGGTPAFTVRTATATGVLLDNVQIVAADAIEVGGPSIALRVLEQANVRLQDVQVEAGLGGPGRPGEAAGTAASGTDGGAGKNGGVNTRVGGEGGGATCVGMSAYKGGPGGSGYERKGGDPGDAGEPDTRGGDGGPQTANTCSPTAMYCTCNSADGLAGVRGADGDAGSDADGGSGPGELRDGSWRANQTGANGQPGHSGRGGGGGGGGGSCNLPPAADQVASGGGGGGGGGGGCGGLGGEGGGGGGASIAVLVIDSQVAFEGSTILRTRGGGAGGPGGEGGVGGQGGAGGSGGTANRVVSGDAGTNTTEYTSVSGAGGNGGPGGNGGNGGRGGGGGGGPSVAVWCQNAQGTVNPAPTLQPGLGGAGGQAVGGIAGVVGESRASVGCNFLPASP
ncbi:hypothetical protein [Corallococcus caeni]